MYLITDEENEATLALCQAYHRLKHLGWKDIADFEPKDDAPFLGVELDSLRPIECEYEGDIFVTLKDDDTGGDVREADLIMFRHCS
jgi:hypothetical protein